MNFHLRCHLCQTAFPATALWVCDKCLGPLEVTYDYAAIAKALVRASSSGAAPEEPLAYRELLPIEGEPRTGLHSGFTPLVRADRLARAARRRASSTSRTTRSIIRPARTRTASSRSPPRAPSSSGSRSSPARPPATLPDSVASHAARLGLACYVFIPDDLEAGKVAGASVYRPRIIAVRGNYDDVNRLCTQVADKYQVGLREHQPARLLRRRRQDLRLRNRRAARLAFPTPRRLAGRRRHAAAANPQGLRGAARPSGSSMASCRRFTRRRRPAVRR